MKPTLTTLSLLAVLACSHLRAQEAPSVTKGNVELGFFAGESYGLDKLRPMFGGNVAYATSRFWYPFVESSYLPGLNRVYETQDDQTMSHYKINMADVHGGVHMRLVRSNSKFVPYIVAGLGIVHSSSTNALVYQEAQNGVYHLTESPQIIPSNTSFAVNFGGGVRYFFKERFGVRVEFKAFIPAGAPTSVSNDVFYRLAIGPVFQIR